MFKIRSMALNQFSDSSTDHSCFAWVRALSLCLEWSPVDKGLLSWSDCQIASDASRAVSLYCSQCKCSRPALFCDGTQPKPFRGPSLERKCSCSLGRKSAPDSAFGAGSQHSLFAFYAMSPACCVCLGQTMKSHSFLFVFFFSSSLQRG